jgi:hypothetical protein
MGPGFRRDDVISLVGIKTVTLAQARAHATSELPGRSYFAGFTNFSVMRSLSPIAWKLARSTSLLA